MTIPVKKLPRNRVKLYPTIRPDLLPGDLLLCSGSGVFSKMIQKATSSVWSHVGFIIPLETIDRVMLLESVEPLGVRTVPLSFYVRNYNATRKPYPGCVFIARHSQMAGATKAKLKRMSKFAVDRFGYPYDKKEILRIAARIGKSLFGFKSSEIERDRDYICSEYAWECYNRVGITVPYDDRAFIAPKDFARPAEVSLIARIV